MKTVELAAQELLRREDDCVDGEPLTATWPELDLRTAYEIQDETLRQRLARGETVIGVKLGLTSRAKQRRMNVNEPLVAWLTDAMVLPLGAPAPRLIHPRVEPEIAFVMGRPLAGPGVTAATAICAVERVFAGLEIIDSRYRDFRFTLPDVVADNASSGAFVTSATGHSPGDLDLALEGCVVSAGGAVVHTATGAAVQGHPAEALALAANTVARRGKRIEAGWLVLTGGVTDAVPLEPGGSVSVEFTNLGRLTVGG